MQTQKIQAGVNFGAKIQATDGIWQQILAEGKGERGPQIVEALTTILDHPSDKVVELLSATKQIDFNESDTFLSSKIVGGQDLVLPVRSIDLPELLIRTSQFFKGKGMEVLALIEKVRA